MKNRVVITTNQILWTIILLNTSSDDWYIDYINDKLNYQIKLNNLEENINILLLDKIEDIQDSENLGEYLNIINNGDISDNYIKIIYNNLEKTKKNCLCFSGIYKSKDGDYVFNQKEENSEEIFIPINKMNPIKKEFILKKFNNYIEGEFKKISAKFIDDILVYIDSDIDLNKTINQETKEPFSIILTAYKTEKFIEECLDSIESQTYFENNDNYEILVGVDGCENTLNKLNEIKDKYRNLYIYMMKENRGTYMTTNALLNLIKYENVIRFDTDDIMEPNLVEDLVDFKNINDDDVIKLGYSDWREGKKINDYVLVNDGIIYFKKSVMDDIAGGYMPWECAADSELISRLKGRVKISGLNKRLFIRRIHDNSLTLRKDTGYKSVKRLKYNNQIKGKYNDDEVKIERVSGEIDDKFFSNIKFINNNVHFSIVIPTMWLSNELFDMLDIYEKSPFVKEVILIDNDPSKVKNLSKYSKLRYYTKGYNIYVNPSWNWGYSLSKYNLILANDDIIINNFDNVMNLISNSDYDIIGVDLVKKVGSDIKIEAIQEFPEKSYGCFMYIKNYTYIPENLKIWYGDNINFDTAKNKGILINADIKTKKSTTINSNIEFFRNNIGKLDINEYKKLTKKHDKLNIIIRTSNRPLYFKECINSIKKHIPKFKIHVTVDDNKDINYVNETLNGIDYNIYLINKESINNICDKISIVRDRFIYNYYFNIINPFLNGWCLFLDDDDEILSLPSYDENIKNNIYLFRVDINKKIVPSMNNFGNPPVLNDISGIGIIFHSSKMIEWKPQRGGDFDFISELYKKNNPVWNKNILSGTQIKGNFGNKKDLIDKNISVNLATYPPREDSLIKCLNNLLQIDLIDVIRVYLNEYNDIPSNFPKNNKILYLLGEKNLKDSGKFYWANDIKNEYYFTIDDDLIYPREYFIDHIKLLKKYDNKIFVSLHGKIMKDCPTTFNDNLKSFHCLKDLDNDEWINNGGTGVMLFDNSIYTIPINFFEYHGMADLFIGYFCQMNKIPIICRKHTSNDLIYVHNNDTLFDRRYDMEKEHKIILNKIGKWILYKK